MRKSSNLSRDFTAFIAHYFTQRLCVGILLTNLRACDSSSFKTKQDNPLPPATATTPPTTTPRTLILEGFANCQISYLILAAKKLVPGGEHWVPGERLRGRLFRYAFFTF